MTTFTNTLPRARASDPETSHAAAASITDDNLSEVKAIIMMLLRQEPMSDVRLVDAFAEGTRRGDWKKNPTFQSICTRRHELEDDGLVQWAGYVERPTYYDRRRAVPCQTTAVTDHMVWEVTA
jgi:hypothetical protein